MTGYTLCDHCASPQYEHPNTWCDGFVPAEPHRWDMLDNDDEWGTNPRNGGEG